MIVFHNDLDLEAPRLLHGFTHGTKRIGDA
jgi:hypothetical protein